MDEKKVERQFKDYQPIDSVFDPLKAITDVEFTEKNKIARKKSDPYSWSHA